MNSIRKQKTQQVDQLTSKLKDSSALVVFSYHGLSVPVMQELRQKLTESNVELKVYKNRLVKIAAKNAGYEDLNQSLIGPNAFAFSASDDIAPAKIISEFAKKHESLKMIAGTYENKVVFSKELLSIAALPSLEEALTMLASSLLSPLKYIAVGLNMIKDLDSKSEVKEETKEVEANVETKEVEENVETKEAETNIETEEVKANVETKEVEANVETKEVEANVETKEVEENVETKEEIKTPSDEIKQSESNKEENNV